LHGTMIRLGFPIADPPQWQDRDTFTITAK
jgi:hypothetical protein